MVTNGILYITRTGMSPWKTHLKGRRMLLSHAKTVQTLASSWLFTGLIFLVYIDAIDGTLAIYSIWMLGLLYSDSHADIEDGEVDPELVVPHLPHVDQVLLAAAVRSGAHISNLIISGVTSCTFILYSFNLCRSARVWRIQKVFLEHFIKLSFSWSVLLSTNGTPLKFWRHFRPTVLPANF